MIEDDTYGDVGANCIPLAPDEAAFRIAARVTAEGNLKGLQAMLFANVEQFRAGMNEAGWNTVYKRTRDDDENNPFRLYAADVTGKDGSQWKIWLWEKKDTSVTVILAVKTREM